MSLEAAGKSHAVSDLGFVDLVKSALSTHTGLAWTEVYLVLWSCVSSCTNSVPLIIWEFFLLFDLNPAVGELRTQKLKSYLVRTQSLNVLPLKPGVGQYIAIHATLTARDFFLAYFSPSGPFTCIFPKTSPNFSLCRLWLTPIPV